ncbi:hypothetical protein HRS9122_05333 [Pyrenophora teres f. teres]|nr:hypothetical protein HRS9122_05333 [Pyrenophora teres f. teres]
MSTSNINIQFDPNSQNVKKASMISGMSVVHRSSTALTFTFTCTARNFRMALVQIYINLLTNFSPFKPPTLSSSHLPSVKHPTQSVTARALLQTTKYLVDSDSMASPAKKRRLTESSSPKEHAAPTIVLAKRGDVLLELSDNGKVWDILLVSSHVLSLASPVFDAMFNGNFTEGQGLSSASPKKVALPDDDPESMTLFCKLVHMQTTELEYGISFDLLADLAIVCDKYRCTESVRSWLQPELPTSK